MKTTGKIILMGMLILALLSCGKTTPGGGGSTAPIVTGIELDIIFPFPGFPVKGKFPIYATTKGGNTIIKVEFYIDGVLKTTVPTGIDLGADGFRFGAYFDTTLIPAGKHTLMVKAYDEDFKVETKSSEITISSSTFYSELDNKFNTPGDQVIDPDSGPLEISGVHQVPGGGVIQAVELFIDGIPAGINLSVPGSFTYTWDLKVLGTEKVIPGDHIVLLKIFNPAQINDTICVSKKITILDKVSPVVNLYSPGLGSVLTSTFGIIADVSDAGGIANVDFYLKKVGSSDWVSYGSATQAPYQVPVVLSDVSKNGEYYIKIVAKDKANNETTFSSETTLGTIKIAYPQKIAVIPAEEGYVIADQDGNNASVGADATRLMIGQQTAGYYGKAIFSFDTSSLAGKTIHRAYLSLALDSVIGEPWTSNTLSVDIHNSYFGASALVEASDWSSAAIATGIDSFEEFSSGSGYSNEFNADGKNGINKTGKTQLRVYFPMNPANAGNYLWLKRGQAILTVEYY